MFIKLISQQVDMDLISQKVSDVLDLWYVWTVKDKASRGTFK